MIEKDDVKKKFPLQMIIGMVSSLLCFAATIWFILMDYGMYAIVISAVQCLLFFICLLITVYRQEPETEDFDEDGEPMWLSGSLTEVLDRDASQIAELQQANNDLTYSNDSLTRQNTELKEENDKLAQLLAEFHLKNASAFDTDALSGILPADENPEDLDLISLTAGLITEMQPFCTSQGIRLEMSSASAALSYHADARYMRLLVRNIIDNSIKYMKQQGSLVITVSNTGSSIFLAFKDNGQGLSLEELPRIFELNYQGSNRVSGNGLGLAQVKAIVDHYKGRIYAHSDNGMGIYIQLPVEQAD